MSFLPGYAIPGHAILCVHKGPVRLWLVVEGITVPYRFPYSFCSFLISLERGYFYSYILMTARNSTGYIRFLFNLACNIPPTSSIFYRISCMLEMLWSTISDCCCVHLEVTKLALCPRTCGPLTASRFLCSPCHPPPSRFLCCPCYSPPPPQVPV